MDVPPPKRIVIVDDQLSFCTRWRAFFEGRFYGRVAVETYTDPVASLAHLGPGIALLMLDLEMPGMDGSKVLAFAVKRGVDPRRIVITSARDADYLHRLFPKGRCLAVINKDEPQQQAAFLLILESIMRKP